MNTFNVLLTDISVEYSFYFRDSFNKVAVPSNVLDLCYDQVVVSADIGCYSGPNCIIENAIRFPYINFLLFVDYDVDFPVSDNLIILHVDYISSDTRLIAKVFKILGVFLFKNCRSVCWIDANLIMISPPPSLPENSSFGFFSHNKRSSVLEELKVVNNSAKDDKSALDQFKSYYSSSFGSASIGLFQGRYFVYKVNDDSKKFFNDWFHMMVQHSIRDQLTLPIALNRYRSKFLLLNSHESYFTVNFHQRYNTSAQLKGVRGIILSFYYKLLYNLFRLLKG